MPEVDTFSQLLVARDRNGGFFELMRNDLEVACPAFDAARQCMVELHIFHSDERGGPNPEIFTRQARAAANIHHPNTAAVFDFGEDEGACFYISEFADGEMLEEYLDRCAPLPEPIALYLVRAAARGVAACASALPVLAGMDLLQGRVRLNGTTTNALTVKVGGYSFGSRKAESLAAAGVHNYYIRSLAEVLLWAVTGKQIGLDELTDRDSASLTEPTLRLLHALDGSRPSIKTLESAVAAISRALDSVKPDLSAPTGLEKLPETLVPLLPLESYFISPDELAAYLGDDYPLNGNPSDARTPLRLSTVDKEQGTQGVVQLLPTDDILPQSLLQSLQAALGRGNALDQPNLIRMLAYWPSESTGFFIEEDAGSLTLEEAVAWKGSFTEEETMLVLDQMQLASDQATACGLDAVIRGAGQVVIHFLEGEPPRNDDTVRGLAGQSLTAWPPFRIKVRGYPTFLSLLRCPPALARVNKNSNSGGAADFAWWAQQMLGIETTTDSESQSPVSQKLATLVNDVVSGRAGAMIHTSREFVRAFRSLVDASPSVASQAPAPAAQATPSDPSSVSPADASATDPEAMAMDLESEDDADEMLPAPGLAEVLFNTKDRPLGASAQESESPIRLPDHNTGHIPVPESEEQDAGEDLEQQSPSTIWLVLVVVGIALLLAAVFAQLSGQAFWLR